MATDVRSVATATGLSPEWMSVLAVVAHPDDESFGLGTILHTFARSGSAVPVLRLAQGAASAIHGVAGNLGTAQQCLDQPNANT